MSIKIGAYAVVKVKEKHVSFVRFLCPCCGVVFGKYCHKCGLESTKKDVIDFQNPTQRDDFPNELRERLSCFLHDKDLFFFENNCNGVKCELRAETIPVEYPPGFNVKAIDIFKDYYSKELKWFEDNCLEVSVKFGVWQR